MGDHIRFDLTGMAFGRLRVVGRDPTPSRRVRWLCVCQCGKTHTARSGDLRRGRTRSCGCLHSDISREFLSNLHRRNREEWIARVRRTVTVNGSTATFEVGRKDGLTVFVSVDHADLEAVLRAGRWRAGRQGRTWYVANDTTYLHRFLLGLNPGDGLEADHRDGCGLICTRANLRVATRAEQMHNLRKQTSHTSSRFRGVHWAGHVNKSNPWTAAVTVGGVRHYLGYFARELDAARAASAARAQLMPFANEARHPVPPAVEAGHECGDGP